MSYKIIYNLNHKIGNFTKEEVEKEISKDPMHSGATDAFMLISILKDELGATSTAVISIDGDTGESLPDTEAFKVWSLIAQEILKSNVPQWQKDIASKAFEAVKAKILEEKK